jgi:predicted methyltransferase
MRAILLLAVLVPMGAIACSRAAPPTPPTASTITLPPPSEAKPLDPATDAKLKASLAGAQRTDKEKLRDPYRHPAETLAFFGLRDTMNVVELWAGGGWYTSVLAPVLAEKGKLTVTHFDPNGPPKSYDTIESKELLTRLDASPDVFGKVGRQLLQPKTFVFGPDGSADLVLTFRSVHNWIDDGYADKVFAASFAVLKSGGVLGVVEHRGKPGMTVAQMKDSGYVPEDYVVSLAQAAGFKLEARSDVNANPKDAHDHPKGVWALPPSFANKDTDRAKYAAIGESDRMTLRFVKP